jgi:hypothetical protein
MSLLDYISIDYIEGENLMIVGARHHQSPISAPPKVYMMYDHPSTLD